MATPAAVPAASPAEGTAIRTIPPNPMPRPASWAGPGTLRRRIAATRAANRGMAPLIIPLSAEDTPRSWASGNRTRGTAIHTRPRRASRGQSDRATGVRDLGASDRAAAPRARRRRATTPGRKDSRPIPIQRNDDPHIAAIAARRAHSVGPKASRRVPSAVATTRAVRMESKPIGGRDLRGLHHQDVGAGPRGHSAGDAAGEPSGSGHPPVPDHDQVAALLLRDLDDAPGRIALDRLGIDL